MKWLLTSVAVSGISGAVIDLIWQSGMGGEISWLRETAMLLAGIGALAVLVKYRKEL